MTKKYILCVDDEKSVLSSLKHELGQELRTDYRFELAESGDEGLIIVKDIIDSGSDLPLVISDQLMPGMKGDEFLVEVNKINPKIRKVMLTGQADAVAVGNAVNNANLFRFISKPWQPEDLLLTCKEAINSYLTEMRLDLKVKVLTDINRYAELFASYIHLEPWSTELLRNLLADLDMYRALLMVYDEETGQPVQIFEGEKDASNKIKVHTTGYDQISKDYPVGILTNVKKNGAAVHLDNAQKSDWAEDPVVESQKIRAVYAAPIIKSGEMLGVLYLDNRLRKDVLEPQHVEILVAVEKQASLALDKIMLYSLMESKINERTRDIQEENSLMKESIIYSSRLQNTVLPNLDELQTFFPDSFIYYKPRDVLSGDFYWFAEVEGVFFLVSADCTGHGVPGAFISMIGINLLNHFVKEKKLTDTAEILNEVDNGFRNMLDFEDEQSYLRDGMDMAIAAVHRKENYFQFSGANQNVITVLDGEVEVYKTDKVSINAQQDQKKDFSAQKLEIQPGMMLYLMSDGVVDQFDAKNDKKFTIARMRDLLKACAKMPSAKQENAIKNRIDIWRGSNNQTDDILVIGVKLGQPPNKD